METLSRLWPYLSLKISPKEVRPVYSAGSGMKILEKFIKDAFELLGIDPRKVVLARKPVIIEKLLVPDRAGRIQNYPFDYFHPVQKEVWAAISSPVKEPGRKVYLSRRELGPDDVAKRHLTNEQEVEDLFSANGFEIIFPERMSFPDQLAIYRDTSVMAGAIGSNLLNAAYCRDETDLVALAPRSFKHRTLLMLAEVKSLNTYLFFSKHSNGNYDKDDPWNIDIGELEEYMLKTGVFRSK
jgi:capsular polysaccharide biosynthesis protein